MSKVTHYALIYTKYDMIQLITEKFRIYLQFIIYTSALPSSLESLVVHVHFIFYEFLI